MELPVNNGDDSEMDTDDDVSWEPLHYDMSFGDSSPHDNRWSGSQNSFSFGC